MGKDEENAVYRRTDYKSQPDQSCFFSERTGEQLVKSGREYRWKKHDSVTVSGNLWYRHSQGRGGYPVDFVMEFYNATFPEAVKKLIGEEGEGRNSTCPALSPDFRLPEKEENNEKIIRYLTENRGIEKNLVEEWISSGDIYEEKKHHNVVFVGRDADGIPRYAHCRGTSEIKYREMWLDLINLADSVTEGRIISCLCLKRPLICFLLSNYFPKTGKSGAT